MLTSQAALELIMQAKDQASDVINNVGSSLGSLGGVAGKIAIGGLAAAGAAIVGVGVAAFKMESDTREAMKAFQAQTGETTESLAEFEQVARDVYTSGWGDSIGEIAEVMATAKQSLDLTGEALEESTRDAMVLSEAFGVDVSESVRTVGQLMTNLGVDSDTAFDIITTGFQEGVNSAGDLQDTLIEYSSDFKRLGFSAEEMLGVLNAGLEEGAYNTDVVAGGIREFGIRFGGAEQAAVDALAAIGLDTESLYAQYQAGEITVADAMETISVALAGVDDKTLQMQAGTALFGSKWEDVGGDVFLAAAQARDGIESIAGATDGAQEALDQGIGPAFERLKRTALDALAPLGGIIADAIDMAIPYLEQATQWLGENVPVAIEWLRDKWTEVWPVINEALTAAWGIIKPVLDQVVGWFQNEGPGAMEGLKEKIGPILETVKGFFLEQFGWVVEWFKENWPLIQETGQTVMEALRTAVQTVLEAVRAFWDEHGERIMEIVGNLWEIIKTIFETGLRTVFDLFKGIMQLITGDTEGFSETMQGIWDRLKEALGEIVGRMWEVIKGQWEIGLDLLSDVWDKTGGKLVDKITQAWEDVKSAIRGVIDTIREVIQALADAVIPDWLKGHSPPPLADWFDDIAGGAAGAAAAMITVNGALRDGRDSQVDYRFPGTGGDAGMGGALVIHNHFGQGSVRSDRDVVRIGQEIEASMARRGVRSFHVR